MKVFTQINKPLKGLDDDEIWLPCLTTSTVKHIKAWKQPLIITHIAAIENYEFDIVELINEQVHCIGSNTYSRLKDFGFTNVSMHGLHADDIRVNQKPIAPATWLHGDRFTKDFGKFTGITAIQTYETSLIDSSLDAIVTMCQNGSLDSLYVYSDMTVEALESKEVDWSAVELFYTDSCKPDSTKWKTIKNFYPGEEGEAPL